MTSTKSETGLSPEQVRRIGTTNGFSSHERAYSAQYSYENGIPSTPSKHGYGQGSGDYQAMQHYNSPPAIQMVQSPPRSNGRASFSSTLRAPRVSHADAASMNGVPEHLAVEEFAYRQGQRDHGSPRTRVVSNPFSPQYDLLWAEHYRRGKKEGGTPISNDPNAHKNHQNFEWATLVNPWTQDLEHPNGFVDIIYTRDMIEKALNCMDAMIDVACARRGDWKKMVIDIPDPCLQALPNFPDLVHRYEHLKSAGKEAVNGGLPKKRHDSAVKNY